MIRALAVTLVLASSANAQSLEQDREEDQAIACLRYYEQYLKVRNDHKLSLLERIALVEEAETYRQLGECRTAPIVERYEEAATQLNEHCALFREHVQEVEEQWSKEFKNNAFREVSKALDVLKKNPECVTESLDFEEAKNAYVLKGVRERLSAQD